MDHSEKIMLPEADAIFIEEKFRSLLESETDEKDKLRIESLLRRIPDMFMSPAYCQWSYDPENDEYSGCELAREKVKAEIAPIGRCPRCGDPIVYTKSNWNQIIKKHTEILENIKMDDI